MVISVRDACSHPSLFFQSMLLPIYDDPKLYNTPLVSSLSTRIGGGQQTVLAVPPRVGPLFFEELFNLIPHARS